MNKFKLILAGILNTVAINAIAIPLLVGGSQVVRVVDPIFKVAKTYLPVKNKALHKDNYINCLKDRDHNICRARNQTAYDAYWGLGEFADIK